MTVRFIPPSEDPIPVRINLADERFALRKQLAKLQAEREARILNRAEFQHLDILRAMVLAHGVEPCL